MQAIMDAFLGLVNPAPTLSLSQTSGNLAAAATGSLQLHVDPTDLAPGSYSAILRFTSNDATAPVRNVPVNLEIAPGLDYYQWSSIASPQVANVPFTPTLAAKDLTDSTIASYNGVASVVARGPLSQNVSGTGTSATSVLGGYYPQGRYQAIYTPAEVGGAGTLRALAVNLITVTGLMKDFTIRLKHSSKADYSSSAMWEDASGWTTVYQATWSGSVVGWNNFALQSPFTYDGTRPLMVDISYDNADFVFSDGTAQFTTRSPARVLWGIEYGGPAPTTWSGTSPSSAAASTDLINLRFEKQEVYPTSPSGVTFINGTATGPLSVQSAAPAVTLVAIHPTRGELPLASNSFSVTSLGSLSLSASAGSGVEGSIITATLTASTAPTSDLTVALSSSDNSAFTVPAQVVLPAGQTNVNFDLTLTDDSVLDGTQTATLTALAPAYDGTSLTVEVTDNESTTLSLQVPATMAEASFATATVSIAAPLTRDADVSLSSDAPARLLVPTKVTIPAGTLSANFTATAPDNNTVEPDVSVTIHASISVAPSVNSPLTVSDDEPHTLWLAGMTSFTEGDTPSNFIRVELSADASMPISINLTSGDTTELILPESITIPPGEWYAGVLVTPVDDTLLDGVQEVDITASATGFATETTSIFVRDDEVHHFQISSIPVQQVPQKPFSVSFTAKDIDNNTITNYAGSPTLSALAGGNPLAITPTTVTGFSTGSRTLDLVISAAATDATITLTDPVTGGSGTSNTFNLAPGPATQFTFAEVLTPQIAAVEAPVSVTAADALGNTVSSYTGQPAIQAFIGAGQTNIGSGSSSSGIPFDTSYEDVRSQILYLQSELGAAKVITGFWRSISRLRPVSRCRISPSG